YEVGGHDADACTLVLANGDRSIAYDFPPPLTASTCDGGPCTRALCTTAQGNAPSFCARTLADGRDRVSLQLEGDAASTFVSRVGRTFTATLTCGGATIADAHADANE